MLAEFGGRAGRSQIPSLKANREARHLDGPGGRMGNTAKDAPRGDLRVRRDFGDILHRPAGYSEGLQLVHPARGGALTHRGAEDGLQDVVVISTSLPSFKT